MFLNFLRQIDLNRDKDRANPARSFKTTSRLNVKIIKEFRPAKKLNLLNQYLKLTLEFVNPILKLFENALLDKFQKL